MEKRHHQFCSSKRRVRTLSVEKIGTCRYSSERQRDRLGGREGETDGGIRRKRKDGARGLVPCFSGFELGSWPPHWAGLLGHGRGIIRGGLGGHRQSRVSKS